MVGRGIGEFGENKWYFSSTFTSCRLRIAYRTRRKLIDFCKELEISLCFLLGRGNVIY